MRSFASPAARVLRSVRSRWQTGWRSACARCRSPAKWSSANDHPLSNLYHGRIGLSSASRFRDSNQPDAAPCRRDGLFSSRLPLLWPRLPRQPDRRRGHDPGGGTGEGWVHLPPAGQGRNSLSHLHPVRAIKSHTTRTQETANWRATSCWTAALTTSTSRPVTALTMSARKPELSIA